MSQNDLTELYVDILDKMIDNQTANVQSVTSIKNSVHDIQDQIKGNKQDLESLKSNFTNGFREEIKKHISEEIEAIQNELSKTCSKVDQLHEMLQKPAFWFKLVTSLLGVLAAFGTTWLALTKFAIQ